MTNGNDLAYPTFESDGISVNTGLTKREYFAAMIMAAVLSSRNYGSNSLEYSANRSAKAADALINELNK